MTEHRTFQRSSLVHTLCLGLVGRRLAACGLIACIWACAPAIDPPGTGASERAQVVASTSGASAASDSELQQLWTERRHDSFTPDFAIGPGDVIQISVPDVQEIKSRVERVSARNTIAIPIAGEVRVGGLTEQQAREAIRAALARLVKDPQVDVFVKEYVSRQVAVIGMVNKPGLYSLTSRSNTILDMIGLAGGLNDRASGRVIFIPMMGGAADMAAMQKMLQAAGTASDSDRVQPHPALETQSTAEGPAGPQKASAPVADGAVNPVSLTLPRESHPIYIELTGLTRGGEDDLPVRPGDVIVVPASGDVLVQGWVATPGAYHITPGLTALGAIAAAGGEMFSTTARVLRAGPNGQRVGIPVDISSVRSGQEPDIAVESGDVVMVDRSVVGAVPYTIYSIFTRFGGGMAVPIPF
jgi:polysaccharide biosynthesis/export protein